MDTKIFKDFEQLIQKEEDFICNNYGRQKFDVCCSVRDWFETCLKHIEPLFSEKNYRPLGLNLYMDIVVADIFQEGAEKLFWNFLNKTTYDQKADTNFFQTRKTTSDDKHLKEIRAVFGAHPFEIGKGKDRESIGRVHYLGNSPSWLRRIEATISRPNGEIESFALDLNELKQFIEHRYGLLECVVAKIKSDINAFTTQMKATPILIDENLPPIEKLNILYEEAGANKRGKIGNGFQKVIGNLRDVFSCKITSSKNFSMVADYRQALIPAIGRQQKILQEMTFLKTWEFEPLLDVFELGLSPQYHRDIQDLRVQDCPFPLGEKVLQDLFRDKFDVTHSTRKEFYLLICAYLFMHSRKKTA